MSKRFEERGVCLRDGWCLAGVVDEEVDLILAVVFVG